jgi:hypothetical protein
MGGYHAVRFDCREATAGSSDEIKTQENMARHGSEEN